VPKETALPSHEKGDVRIRYEMVGSGFPLLRITMDQRNANGGESTGPIPARDPWGAFADDQLGLMDHLGIRKKAQSTVFPWRQSKDLLDKTIHQVRAFLKSHQPA
jgi:hypothetical protein